MEPSAGGPNSIGKISVAVALTAARGSRTVAENKHPPNELKVGAVLSYTQIGVQFIVAMLYTPVMLRLLGQAEYGLYSLVASVVSYLGLLSFGFAGAYMRFYARFRAVEDWEGAARLNGLFLLVFTVIGLLAAAGGMLLTLNVESVLGSQFSSGELKTARFLFGILTVNLAVTFPASVFNSYVTAHERFIFQKSLQIVSSIVSPLVVLPVLLLGYRSVGMAVGTTVVNIAFTAYTVAFSWSRLKMRFTFKGLDFGLFREVAAFSSFLFINMVVDQVNWNVGKFIIGIFHGAIPVAVYGVAAMFNALYLTFSTALSNVFIPRINRLVAASSSDRELSDLFTRVGRLQFLVLGLVVSGFTFFGRPFIELWAGPDYVQAYYMALFLMIPVTAPLIQNLGIEIQKAKNLHQFRSWVYLGVAIANVLLSIPLTQRYQGTGAAAGTATSLIIGNVIIMNWHYQARVGLDIKDFWRQTFRLSRGLIPALAAGALIASLVDLSQFELLLPFGVIYVVVYAVGMWCLGMNDYERHLVTSAQQQIFMGRRGRR